MSPSELLFELRNAWLQAVDARGYDNLMKDLAIWFTLLLRTDRIPEHEDVSRARIQILFGGAIAYHMDRYARDTDDLCKRLQHHARAELCRRIHHGMLDQDQRMIFRSCAVNEYRNALGSLENSRKEESAPAWCEAHLLGNFYAALGKMDLYLMLNGITRRDISVDEDAIMQAEREIVLYLRSLKVAA